MRNLIKGRAYHYDGMYVFELLPVGIRKPKGIFVFLHGFPGWVTKNYDIAEQLCFLGYVVLIPHYPGLGFSAGRFSFKELGKAINNFLEFVKKQYNLPISLLGHSWGGYLAMSLCHHIEKLLVLLAPLSVFPTGKSLRKSVDALLAEAPSDCKHYMRMKMQNEIESLGKTFSLKKFINKMVHKHFLVIHGINDVVTPIKDSRVLIAKSKGAASLIELDDGHLLFRNRRNILEYVSKWVKVNEN